MEQDDSRRIEGFFRIPHPHGHEPPIPSLDDYWRRDSLLHYTPIADRITHDCYHELLRYLHFADNDSLVSRGSPGYDRLQKV